MYQYPSYLAHYGVIGMKWGVHRSKRAAIKSAKYKAAGNTEKAAKYAAKSKKITAKHKSLAGGKTYSRVAKQSMFETVGKSLLLGSYGTLKYEQAKSAGKSTGKAIVSGWGHQAVSNLTYGVMSVAEPHINRGNTSKKAAKAEKKAASKAYSKSYNKAYRYSQLHPISQFVSKKNKAKSGALWDDAYDKAKTLNKAHNKYKQAKNGYNPNK